MTNKQDENLTKRIVGWSVQQLSEAARLDKSRINQLIKGGQINAYLVAKTWIIRDAEAKRFLQSRGIEL